MLPESNPLELVLHLSDGRTVRFSQSNERLAKDLLNGIQPDSVFEKKVLLLCGEDSVSVFPTERVARIDTSRALPEWLQKSDAISADQIADYDFQWLRETLSAVQKTLRQANRSEQVIVAADIELSNSERIYLRIEFHGRDASANPQSTLLNHLLQSGGLLIRLRQGGYSIINPANLVRLTVYPIYEEMNCELTAVAAS